jgi:hypothetical protein
MNIKKVYLLLIILIIFSCKEASTVKEIKIGYINTYIDLPHSLDCWDIFSIDTMFLSQIRIKDPKITTPIYNIVRELQVDTTYKSVDVRITCLLRYNTSRSTDTLCLGENSGTVLNGVNVCDNKKLHILVKEQLQVSNFEANTK